MVALPQTTTPGAWQSIVDANPGATEFVIGTGISREQGITIDSANDGIQVRVPSGADVRGSRVLSSWSGSGPWTHAHTSSYKSLSGATCEAEYPMCNYRDQLWRDGEPLRQVSTLAQLDRDSYYVDHTANTITIGKNPSGNLMEVSVTSRFITKGATPADGGEVTGPGILRHYTSPLQNGIIQTDETDGWRFYDGLQIIWNVNGGLDLIAGENGDGCIATDVICSYNGQLNFKANRHTSNTFGDGIELVRCTNDGGGWRGVSAGWEGGGSKFVRTRGMVVKHCYFRNNIGAGCWFDIDNFNPWIYGGEYFGNWWEAVKLEIGFGAIVDSIHAKRNGLRTFGRNGNGIFGGWGAAVHAQNTSGVVVQRSKLEDNGRAFGQTYQDRGTGTFGPYTADGFKAFDNEVYAIARIEAANSHALAHISTTFVEFDRNTYHYSDQGDSTPFYYPAPSAGAKTFAEWQALGLDVNSTMTTRY